MEGEKIDDENADSFLDFNFYQTDAGFGGAEEHVHHHLDQSRSNGQPTFSNHHIHSNSNSISHPRGYSNGFSDAFGSSNGGNGPLDLTPALNPDLRGDTRDFSSVIGDATDSRGIRHSLDANQLQQQQQHSHRQDGSDGNLRLFQHANVLNHSLAQLGEDSLSTNNNNNSMDNAQYDHHLHSNHHPGLATVADNIMHSISNISSSMNQSISPHGISHHGMPAVESDRAAAGLASSNSSGTLGGDVPSSSSNASFTRNRLSSTPTSAESRTYPLSSKASNNTPFKKKSHKDIERRRREAIAQGITELALLVPDAHNSKKGKVIERAVDYIHSLREAEQQNMEKWTFEKLMFDET
ncbi:basic helix-loop-helix protein [Chytriomyces hyalinus]|nr:basic helix-loop-helix protein [Chytriomyces hyalinus]